jgi:hypothetical protein
MIMAYHFPRFWDRGTQNENLQDVSLETTETKNPAP